MGEKLSVVIPVYNAEDYLRRALDSVLRQAYPVHEVVCVDDGSTDGSLNILNEYALCDRRVKVIHKDNGGSTSARKAGVLKAQGSYITFVDADDFIESEMYDEMMALAVKYNADLVTSGLIRDYGTSITVESEEIEEGVYRGDKISSKILSALIDKHHFYKARLSPHIVNMIFRANILRKVQANVDDRICVGDDDAVIYPFLFRSSTVVISGSSYYHYCIRENGSIMGIRGADDYGAILVLFDHLQKEFKEADGPGLDLMKQFQILKSYFLMLRFPTKVLRYNGEILYPFGRIKKKDKILLYGAGKFGVAMKSYLEDEGFQLAAWVDKSANRPGVVRPDEISQIDFDLIIIAVLVADGISQIRNELNGMGISDEKVIFVDAGMIK